MSQHLTDREVMQQALEALEMLARYENPETKIQVRKKDGGPIVTMYPHKVANDAATALRDRLVQPEDEPVAWVCEGMTCDEKHSIDYEQSEIDAIPVGTMLYTRPQPRKGQA